MKLSNLPLIEFIALTLLFLLTLVLDGLLSLSMFWQFRLLILFFMGLLILPRLLITRQKAVVALFLGFALLLFLLPLIDTSPVKPFRRFYQNIDIGMHLSQVQANFEQQFPADGKFRQPVSSFGDGSPFTLYDHNPSLTVTPNKSLYYTLDPDDGRFNSEILVIYFKDDKVVGSEYLPD